MQRCQLCLGANYAQWPTLCMGAPGGLYRPTPRGYNGNPTGIWSQPSVSTLAGFSAGWWVPPAAGYSVDRPAPPHRVLPAAAYCSLVCDDEGFVEVSVATVGRLGGYHCSLTSSCLLNGAPASRKGVAGSRRDPPAGGTQQPAEKPASVDTDGWDQFRVGLPLYPRGVGLYKPPGAPMQRVRTQA